MFQRGNASSFPNGCGFNITMLYSFHDEGELRRTALLLLSSRFAGFGGYRWCGCPFFGVQVMLFDVFQCVRQVQSFLFTNFLDQFHPFCGLSFLT